MKNRIKILMLSLALVMSAFAFSPHQAILTGHSTNVAIAASLPDCDTVHSGLVPDPQTGLCIRPGGTISVNALIVRIINVLLGIVAALAILFIVIGGFQYITSAGNEEQAGKGKKTLVNAIIGLVIVILAYVIVNVIANAVGGVQGQGFLGLF